MNETYSLQRLLLLRKMTRAVADVLRGQLKEYLATLAPVLRPRLVLGEYVQGSTKEGLKGPERAFKDLQDLYLAIAGPKPFNLPKELKPPLEIVNTNPELSPLEYTHVAGTGPEGKPVRITSPLKWVLAYSGFAPGRLKELLASRAPAADEVHRTVLHNLVLHVVATRQAGFGKLLEALRFPLSTTRLPDSGELPVTCISACISTLRPPDGVIIESTELSGKDVFEEVINLADIPKLRDPMKEQLIELVRSYGEPVEG